jgi:hypothetical protein
VTDYPDLSRWPDDSADAALGARPWSPVGKELREAMAGVDPVRDGFPLHDHVVHDRAADGSVTLSVPWSEFRFAVPAGATEAEAKRGFNRAYLAHVAASKDEATALRQAVVAAGYVPLGEQIERKRQR